MGAPKKSTKKKPDEKTHQELMQKVSGLYDKKLDDEMGKLHNQFVGFISAAELPIPQVLLVLEMLKKETVDQAYRKYLGG